MINRSSLGSKYFEFINFRSDAGTIMEEADQEAFGNDMVVELETEVTQVY